jgi:hypothetical protein
MAEIGISQVLAMINQPIRDDKVYIFSIGFVRVSENGKTGKKGEVKLVNRCMKYSTKRGNSGGSSRYNISLREHSTLLLTDMDTDETVHVKTWSITTFNGQKVRH